MYPSDNGFKVMLHATKYNRDATTAERETKLFFTSFNGYKRKHTNANRPITP